MNQKQKRFLRRFSKREEPPQPPDYTGNFREDCLAFFNHEREKWAFGKWKKGHDVEIGPLERDPRLDACAQSHADYMAKWLKCTHEEYNGGRKGIGDRIRLQGFRVRNYIDCSENIGVFCCTPSGGGCVTWLWMGHYGHRRNILDPRWEKVGFGCSKGSDEFHYWCATFGKEWTDFVPSYFFRLEEDQIPASMREAAPSEPQQLVRFVRRPDEGSYNPNIGQSEGEIMKKNEKKPHFDALDQRELMAANVTSTLAGGVLAIVGTNQNDSIRVSQPTAGIVQLDVKGQQSKTWATSAVKSIAITSLNGNDSIINLTQIPSTVVAGNGNNYINTGDPSKLGTGANDVIRVGNGNNVIQDSGGTDVISGGNGNNVVFAYGKDNLLFGNGDNVLYNIVAGNGQNRVITNNNFKVSVGQNSLPTYIFGGRTAPVTLDANGILNFQAATGNTSVTIDDNYDGTITTTFTNDATGVTEVDTFQKSQVTGIGAIFGKGTGTFVNNTDIDDVVYGGGGGNNTLVGGQGFNFMKSNSANDTIIGGDGGLNILSEGGQNGTIVGGQGNNILVAGFSGTATVLSTGQNDVVTGDAGPASIFTAKKTKFYN